MNHLNNICLEGILVAEPTHRTITSNRPIVSFRLASKRAFKKADNTWGEKTTFVDIEAWDHAANHALKWLHKGTRCAISGRLEQDNWTDQKTGQNRSKLYITAETITNTMHLQPLDSKPQDSTNHPNSIPNRQSSIINSQFTDDIPF